jgi:hypothetical protein
MTKETTAKHGVAGRGIETVVLVNNLRTVRREAQTWNAENAERKRQENRRESFKKPLRFSLYFSGCFSAFVFAPLAVKCFFPTFHHAYPQIIFQKSNRCCRTIITFFFNSKCVGGRYFGCTASAK